MDDIVAAEIERYAENHTTPPPPYLEALAEETRSTLSAPGMMVGPVEGRVLEMLVFISSARRVLEIGTFSGYSALSMAAGLPDDGHIVTCELDPRHAEVARRHIAASPFADRIDVRLGRALDTILGLEGPFDLVFIDADKSGYIDYYEAVLPKLARRGVIVADNTLWSGAVADPADAGDLTKQVR
ncbi:MAG TPA: O-methyltransferase, partial [Acidimicrobiales bacterium]